ITDCAGNPLNNGFAEGIVVLFTGGTVIGGTTGTIGPLGTAGFAGNLISGNATGVDLRSPGNTVQGNLIGTDWTGLVALGNYTGLYLADCAANNTIGGTAAGAGNVISGNHSGVVVTSGTGNSILGNSIHDNGGLGIDLSSGANNNQAAPVLTAAYAASGATIVTGTITSTPSATFQLEFFANAAGDPEGRTFLGSGTVTTDASGHGSFTAFLSAALPAGQGL